MCLHKQFPGLTPGRGGDGGKEGVTEKVLANWEWLEMDHDVLGDHVEVVGCNLANPLSDEALHAAWGQSSK